MPVKLTSKQAEELLAAAVAQAGATGADLEGQYPDFADRLRWLLEDSTPVTYLPILCVCLVGRVADADIDVRKVKPGADYNAALVGSKLTDFARRHEVDMRTDTTSVMNSIPFGREPAITPDLTETVGYAEFYEAVEEVQASSQEQARDLLALAMHLGHEHWPHRKRRVQRNQVHHDAPAVPAEHFFILNQSPHEEFSHYDGDDYYGFHGRVTSAKALVSAGEGQFVFYRTSDAPESPMSFVGSGRISRVEDAGVDDENRRRWRAYIEDYTDFAYPVPKQDAAPGGWNVQHSIAAITAEAFERIVRLGDGEQTVVEPITVESLATRAAEEGLLLGDDVLASLVGALESGKHVILTGPPGTAKTTLATLVARLATDTGHSTGLTLGTATADWTTYDTVGGLKPRADGTLAFQYGLFLTAIERNRWLVVDELNRSNFDRAFGSLFTVLAGEDVELTHTHAEDGRTLRIRHEERAPDEQYHDIVVSNRWRMIATINNFDKSLLFEMSFALMRRFAFVEVPAPSTEQYLSLIDRVLAADPENIRNDARDVVVSLLPMRSVKEIGPAIFLDATRMARSMLTGSDLAPKTVTLMVFYALLLPQFEGVEEREGRTLQKLLTKAVGTAHAARGTAMLREVLGLDLGESAALDERDQPEPDEPVNPGGDGA